MQNIVEASADSLTLPANTEFAVFLQAVFDTGLIIDTANFDGEQYQKQVRRTLAQLQHDHPDVMWGQEAEESIRGSGDPTDYLPTLNLSYITATSPNLIAQRVVSLPLPGKTAATVTFAQPTVYFHTFSAGLISVKATIASDKPIQQSDLQMLNNQLQSALKTMSAEPLKRLITAFVQAVQAVETPIYTTPFPDLLPPALKYDLFYWSHLVYVTRSQQREDVVRSAQWLMPVLQPMDQQGISNMAIKPDRYIFFGWGRSMICCTTQLGDDVIYPYVRMLEIRNYVWKTLYDLDRGLRKALSLSSSIRSHHEARRLVIKLRALNFRVKDFLEEMEPFKITFDHEKIWLIKQADINWLTPDLVQSVAERLQVFSEFFAYNEDVMTRARDERLQAILNLIGVVATAGAITEIINYFDPLFKLPISDRASLFVSGLLIVIVAYYTTMLIARRVRHGE